MKIPKSYKQYGQTVNIEFRKKMVAKDGDLGAARFGENKIVLQENNEGCPILQTQLEQTFLHEKVHMIFHFLGEKDMSENEKLVEGVSQLLHQSIITEELE